MLALLMMELVFEERKAEWARWEKEGEGKGGRRMVYEAVQFKSDLR